jgi:type IV secretory pathway TrbL component
MMAEAPRESPAEPLSVRLSIPASGAFRAVATALAGTFARAAGWSGGDADRLGEAVERAAADAAARAGDAAADLDVEMAVVGPCVEVRVGPTAGPPALVVIRMEPAG